MSCFLSGSLRPFRRMHTAKLQPVTMATVTTKGVQTLSGTRYQRGHNSIQ